MTEAMLTFVLFTSAGFQQHQQPGLARPVLHLFQAFYFIGDTWCRSP